MWIRVKDSGQEIDIPDSRARYFIANGDAIEIQPPVVKPTVMVPTPPARRLSTEPHYDAAVRMVHAAGLPLNATEIVMRLLALEDRFNSMIEVRLQQVHTQEKRK